jgi:hypothetical protein
VKITVLVEGRTEKAFMPTLREFLKTRLAGRMPNIDPFPCNGRVYTGAKLRRAVEALLTKRPPSDAVIALTDVYTGTSDFTDAADAKRKMREWVGNDDKFYPHAAQHDFEAWLLPFWADIQRLAGSNRGAPGGTPESVDHKKPPSKRIAEVFEAGSRGRSYSKPREAALILQGKDLAVAAGQCPELKAFLNTILTLNGAEPL